MGALRKTEREGFLPSLFLYKEEKVCYTAMERK
jgi:hypothetical protein